MMNTQFYFDKPFCHWSNNLNYQCPLFLKEKWFKSSFKYWLLDIICDLLFEIWNLNLLVIWNFLFKF